MIFFSLDFSENFRYYGLKNIYGSYELLHRTFSY